MKEIPTRKYFKNDEVYRFGSIDENTTTIEKHIVTDEGFSVIEKIEFEGDEEIIKNILVPSIGTDKLAKNIFIQEKEFYTLNEIKDEVIGAIGKSSLSKWI